MAGVYQQTNAAGDASLIATRSHLGCSQTDKFPNSTVEEPGRRFKGHHWHTFVNKRTVPKPVTVKVGRNYCMHIRRNDCGFLEGLKVTMKLLSAVVIISLTFVPYYYAKGICIAVSIPHSASLHSHMFHVCKQLYHKMYCIFSPPYPERIRDPGTGKEGHLLPTIVKWLYTSMNRVGQRDLVAGPLPLKTAWERGYSYSYQSTIISMVQHSVIVGPMLPHTCSWSSHRQ